MSPMPHYHSRTLQKVMGLLALILAAISALSAMVAHREMKAYEPMYGLSEPTRDPAREAKFLQQLRAHGNPEFVVQRVESLQGIAFHSDVSMIRQLKYQQQMLSFGLAVFTVLTLGLVVIGAVLLIAPSSAEGKHKHAA